MPVPGIAAKAIAAKLATDKRVQGAASSMGAQALWRLGKGAGLNQGKRTAAKAMASQGIKRRTANKAYKQAATGSSKISQQAANVATSPGGAAAIGAGGYAMYSNGTDNRKNAKHPHPRGY